METMTIEEFSITNANNTITFTIQSDSQHIPNIKTFISHIPALSNLTHKVTLTPNDILACIQENNMICDIIGHGVINESSTWFLNNGSMIINEDGRLTIRNSVEGMVHVVVVKDYIVVVTEDYMMSIYNVKSAMYTESYRPCKKNRILQMCLDDRGTLYAIDKNGLNVVDYDSHRRNQLRRFRESNGRITASLMEHRLNSPMLILISGITNCSAFVTLNYPPNVVAKTA